MTQSSSTFPTSIDSFDDPQDGDLLGGPSNVVDHVEHTKWIVDALEKLEAKVGIDGSLVSTSLDRQMEVHAHTSGADDGGAIAISNTTGTITDTQHGVFTSGDLHTDYPEIGASETITATWTFEQNITFEDGFAYFGGFAESIQAASTDMVLNAFTTNDAEYRFQLRSDGQMEWGGGTVLADTNLYRSAADTLKTDDSLVVAGSIKQSTTKTVLDTDHTAAADPHTGYRLESADHTHASTGIQGGTIDHGALTGLADDDHPQYATDSDLTTHAGAADPHTGYLKESVLSEANVTDLTDGGATTLHTHAFTGAPADVDYLVGTASGGLSAEIVVGTSPGGELGGTWASPTVDATHSGSTHTAATTTHEAAADPHTGYLKESEFNAKGDIITASANDTPSLLTVGANDTMLMADSAAAGGLKWVAPAASAVTITTGGTDGTADNFSRGDHAHAHETAHVAHDTIWDAKGDLVVGSASDTAVVKSVGSDGQVLLADSASPGGVKWDALPPAGGSAPDNATYLTTTANATLSAEVVVGATPGGELGGTWASPTVDAVHSGSAHTAIDASTFWDAKGDLIAGSGADAAANVGVGANNTMLVADSAQTAGIKWANIVEANITAGTITNASIANRTRSYYIPAALIQTVSGVAATLGTEPDQLDTKRLDDAATDAAYAQFMVPSDWASGALTLRFWLSMAATGGGAVRLDTTYKEMNGGDPIAAGTNIAAANVTLTNTVNPQSTDFTLGTPSAANTLWRVCVRRTGGNAGDTYAQNLRILGFEIRYTADM